MKRISILMAVVLVSFFVFTLSIGILSSMFTAIMGTRAVINLLYGGRRVAALSI